MLASAAVHPIEPEATLDPADAHEHIVRPIDPAADAEVALVASRMRLTLMEVLGDEAGAAMYTPEWLEARVRFHLDPAQSTAQVFVSVAPDGALSGHTIVRIERDGSGREFGLFSTTYVEPSARRRGVADALVRRGEQWLREAGMTSAETYTSESNAGLIALFESHGYAITLRVPDKRMLVLSRKLAAD